VTATYLSRRSHLVGPDAVTGTLLDVRQQNEFVDSHVPGANNVELGALADATIADGAVTVMCGHGERAMTGASVLAARTHTDLRVLAGGPTEWAATTGGSLVCDA
jgi:hydroxyacylglutathione hydrolase